MGLIELIWRCCQHLAGIFICLITALNGKGNLFRPIALRLRAAGTEQYEAGQDGRFLHGSSPLSFAVWHARGSTSCIASDFEDVAQSWGYSSLLVKTKWPA